MHVRTNIVGWYDALMFIQCALTRVLTSSQLDGKTHSRVLARVIASQFNDHCAGCIEKDDYIRRIRELAPADSLPPNDEL